MTSSKNEDNAMKMETSKMTLKMSIFKISKKTLFLSLVPVKMCALFYSVAVFISLVSVAEVSSFIHRISHTTVTTVVSFGKSSSLLLDHLYGKCLNQYWTDP